MGQKITEQWIIETMSQDRTVMNTLLFVYPDGGMKKPELGALPGEKICGSFADVYYLSTKAIYLQDRSKAYVRIPWIEIDSYKRLMRSIKGNSYARFQYTLVDGRKFDVTFPTESMPWYFCEVHEECMIELSAGGKKCRLPGPVRLHDYAQPVVDDAPWLQKIARNSIVWVSELQCPCKSTRGFSLRYLGKLLSNGLIADTELRQKIVVTCLGCKRELELFDAYHHGYNAVICKECEQEPPDRQPTHDYKCSCGKNQFALGVAAVFDADSEDLLGFRKDRRSEAYGWFCAMGTCKSCGKVCNIIDYETA